MLPLRLLPHKLLKFHKMTNQSLIQVFFVAIIHLLQLTAAQLYNSFPRF